MTTEDTPAPDPATFDIDAWLAGASRPETVVTLSSKGKEYGEFKVLEVQLMAAQKAAENDDDADQRLITISSAEPRRIAEQMDALAKVIEKGRHPFRLRGLSDPDLKAIREQAKDLDEDDTNPILLAKCCIDPQLTPAKWVELREALGEGQWTQVIREANRVSFEGAQDAPFSVAAFAALSTHKL